MKALFVAVVEIPDYQGYEIDDFYVNYELRCGGETFDERHYCPLRPLPQKKVGDDLYKRYGSWTLSDEKEASYRVGFNDCLEAITGETE